MSFEMGLQAFKQNKFEVAIEYLSTFCQDCDTAGTVTSQRYMQAHMGLIKSYQKLKQFDTAIAHCQSLTESKNHALTIWVDKMLPKLQSAAETGGDQSESSEADAESNQPHVDENLMLLQQGMVAYKKMQRDRAIKLLGEYVKQCDRPQSRNYMQAQMTLVKAYKETKQIEPAIALCQQLATSDNFALKSWASKALPKLEALLDDSPSSESSASPSPSVDAATQPKHPAHASSTAALTQPDSNSVASTKINPEQADLKQADLKQADLKPADLKPADSSQSSSTFTFDASPRSSAQPSVNRSGTSTSSRPASANRQSTTTSRQTLSRPKRTSRTSSKSRQKQRSGSSKLVNNSIAHSGIGMVGGAFGAVLGQFMLKRFMRAGIGLVFGIIVFIFKGYAGSDSGLSPLQAAVSDGQIDSVEKLIDQGKSLEKADSEGNTILYWALVEDQCDFDSCQISARQQEVVNLLLDKGAQVAVTNDWQETPLHFAASLNGSPDIMRTMLNRGANVNARDSLQLTPLHWAANYGIEENIELLLNRGADVNAQDADGYTPLDVVATEEAAQLLESRGATYGQ